jgi:hypothetical protein
MSAKERQGRGHSTSLGRGLKERLAEAIGRLKTVRKRAQGRGLKEALKGGRAVSNKANEDPQNRSNNNQIHNFYAKYER